MKPRPVASTALLAISCNASLPPPSPCTGPSVATLPRWASGSEQLQDSSRLTEPSVRNSSPSGSLRAPSRSVAGPSGHETIRIKSEKPRDPLASVLGPARNKHIGSLSVRDAPVMDTLELLAEMGRFNVVASDEVSKRKVSIELRNVRLLPAFRAVLASAHLEGRVVADNIILVDDVGKTPLDKVDE